MHRSYAASQFSCHAEHCPALHWSTSHTFILIPHSREKDLRSILAPIILTGIRPEMFRFAQHDSGICNLGSKPVALFRHFIADAKRSADPRILLDRRIANMGTEDSSQCRGEK